MRDALADYRPDVVLVDQYAVAGAAVAEQAGLRWATLCTGAMELTPPDWELPGHQDWVAERLDRIAGWAGLTPDPALDLRFSPAAGAGADRRQPGRRGTRCRRTAC